MFLSIWKWSKFSWHNLFIRIVNNVADHTAEKRMRRYIEASRPVISYIDKLYISRKITLEWWLVPTGECQRKGKDRSFIQAATKSFMYLIVPASCHLPKLNYLQPEGNNLYFIATVHDTILFQCSFCSFYWSSHIISVWIQTPILLQVSVLSWQYRAIAQVPHYISFYCDCCLSILGSKAEVSNQCCLFI